MGERRANPNERRGKETSNVSPGKLFGCNRVWRQVRKGDRLRFRKEILFFQCRSLTIIEERRREGSDVKREVTERGE